MRRQAGRFTVLLHHAPQSLPREGLYPSEELGGAWIDKIAWKEYHRQEEKTPGVRDFLRQFRWYASISPGPPSPRLKSGRDLVRQDRARCNRTRSKNRWPIFSEADEIIRAYARSARPILWSYTRPKRRTNPKDGYSEDPPARVCRSPWLTTS